MDKLMRAVKLVFNSIRLLPHLIILRRGDKEGLMRADLERWASVYCKRLDKAGKAAIFVRLMSDYPEYRNLFYARAESKARFIRWLCKPMSTLFINTRKIGPGLFIQHGFATIILAKEIGSGCWINQQVTIGCSATGEFPPTIGNNVIINAGAKVIGDIVIGDNVTIGANAVVVKNVPPNVTVVGVPARIVRRDGVRVDEKL